MIEFPSLKIETINAKINITKTDPKINITGQTGDFKLIKTEHRFEVEKKDAELLIHNYPAFRQLDNSKNIMDMTDKVASQSLNDSYTAIAEYASDGDAMMKIDKKSASPIPYIAKRKAERNLKAKVKLDVFPKNPIQIDVRKGYVTSSYSPGKIETISKERLNISAQMGEINIKANYPKVNINVIGGNINYKG
ncbi:DUF6470 family protein [Haliovirga abyssi]|uniref:Adhesin domain-containing protein n=1 Tax=Haliovirga abyssi TaxID=2996794 RepID=A0AAU9DZS1_9FUSO|nr:DUF6470 family protein [Haliovirga abyssi]BDU51080.1 hypothetical protein HLVA_16490 [Haliovirga abyssi]